MSEREQEPRSETLAQSGLLILHGNRLELLAQAVFEWLGAHPLGPLEEACFVVQSNGMAEWLKMELATSQGVCAATRVELPARFIWRTYRAVLGRSAVPAQSALDKLPLTWRLMQALPLLAQQPGFEPVDGFLGRSDGAGADDARRLQLAQRLADLFDQYQVYRGDWLQAWAQGQDRIGANIGPSAGLNQQLTETLPEEQRWQPALWRALLAAMSPAERQTARSALHQRFLAALAAPDSGPWPKLPRRVVLFGTTHIPHQSLAALAALSAQCQVLMAVPNPCRYHWADIIDGRELARAQRRRQSLRQGRELAEVPLTDMHLHGHPLLAAWGRQARDFVRQLDQVDDVQTAQQRFDVPRVDLFDEGPGETLLGQVQAAIRDLLPLAEHAWPAQQLAAPAAVNSSDDLTAELKDDRSIVFHIAHSAQREVEILHDQLLQLLAAPAVGAGVRPLAPRDVVVMVPDVDRFAPAIRSVFGQHTRGQARHIPWGITDQHQRGQQALLVALEWLLRAPQQRFAASELRDLLDVPAVTLRLGLAAEDLPQLMAWIEGAGIRWGLHAGQRASLGLASSGELNSWAFGLRRMLLGYASGELTGGEGFAGSEPYTEVAGLSAGLAGTLAQLLEWLGDWWQDAQAAQPPAVWAQRLRRLLADFFKPGADEDSALLAALDAALTDWLQACESAGFDSAVTLAVVREAWLQALDAPGGGQRFKAGGVTFCTLLPMRAIPFEVVCLLGMNDGDYPRRSPRSDFDLMALPGQARPGDRSRRDDDRQLMLDALQSARRVLYISWTGRSQRDQQQLPPSVLVSQLRDYLAAGWGADTLAPRTTEHPLQPFSRSYFEAPRPGAAARLFSYAAEWRAAHEPRGRSVKVPVDESSEPLPTAVADSQRLSINDLALFLRNPVKAYFRHRLQVNFDQSQWSDEDDEPFSNRGLERWALVDEWLRDWRLQSAADAVDAAAEPGPWLQLQLARAVRAGRLPLAGPGRCVQAELQQALLPMLRRWQQLRQAYPEMLGDQALHFLHPQQPGLVLQDTLADLRGSASNSTSNSAAAATPASTESITAAPSDQPAPRLWLALQAGRLTIPGSGGRGQPALREDRLLTAWLRCLASAACGEPAQGIVVAEGAVLRLSPPSPEQALDCLPRLMQAWHQSLQGAAPLPTALKTGLALLRDPGKAQAVYDGGSFQPLPGEGREPCLARLYPRYAVLRAQPGFEATTRLLYEDYRQWLQDHVEVELLDEVPAAAGSAWQADEAAHG